MDLLPEEVTAKALSCLSLRDGWKAAAACKTYRACWRRRCRGMLRLMRNIVNIGPPVTQPGLPALCAPECITATPGGGVIIVNHGVYAHWVTAGTLETYSSEGNYLATRGNLSLIHI